MLPADLFQHGQEIGFHRWSTEARRALHAEADPGGSDGPARGHHGGVGLLKISAGVQLFRDRCLERFHPLDLRIVVYRMDCGQVGGVGHGQNPATTAVVGFPTVVVISCSWLWLPLE